MLHVWDWLALRQTCRAVRTMITRHIVPRIADTVEAYNKRWCCICHNFYNGPQISPCNGALLRAKHYRTRICYACFCERHRGDLIDVGPWLCKMDTVFSVPSTLTVAGGIYNVYGEVHAYMKDVVLRMLMGQGYQYDMQHARQLQCMAGRIAELWLTHAQDIMQRVTSQGARAAIHEFIRQTSVFVYGINNIREHPYGHIAHK